MRLPCPTAAALLAGLLYTVPAAPVVAADSSGPAEPAITVAGAEGDYLRAIHRQLHPRWGALVGQVARTTTSAATGAARQTVVLFSVRWDGTVAGASLVESSGSELLDKGALALFRNAASFGVPSLDLMSDDGLVHFRWVLASDRRLCSGAQLRRKEDPIDEAMPRLFHEGRVKQALLRVARHLRMGAGGGAGDVVGAFARSWLARPHSDPVADVTAAAALARHGDAGQLQRLRAGLTRPDTVAVAVSALGQLDVDVCGAVGAALRAGQPAARELAVAAIRLDVTAPRSSSRGGGTGCTPALVAIAGDRTLPGRLRALALDTLAKIDISADETRRLLANGLKDGDAAVRAAAILASARPGGGKAALYRLQPWLRDRALEVRAAAAAGLVRAGGDEFLIHIAPVLKERNARVAAALAPELGRLASEGTAILLASFMRMDDADVRVAAVRALAVRHDDKARALLAPILAAAKDDPRAPGAVRELALSTAGLETLMPSVADPAIAARVVQLLVQAKRHRDAAELLLSHFDRLTGPQLAAVFGAWLDHPPPDAAVSSRRSRHDDEVEVK